MKDRPKMNLHLERWVATRKNSVFNSLHLLNAFMETIKPTDAK